MNRKLLGTIILGAATVFMIFGLVFSWSKYYNEHETQAKEETVLSDEELMQYVIVENHGEEYYGVLIDNDDNETVNCLVYSNDGDLRYIESFNREYYQNHYNYFAN